MNHFFFRRPLSFHMSTILLTFLCGVALGADTPATSARTAQVLAELEKTSTMAMQINPALTQSARSASSEIVRLSGALANIPGLPPGKYLNVLDLYLTQIKEINRDVTALESAQSMLELLDDLRLKNAYLANGLGYLTPDRAFVHVKIKVSNEKNLPIPGVLLTANYRRYARMRPPLFTFSQLTSDSGTVEEKLLPGSYVVEARLRNKVVGEKNVRVGLTGASTQIEDIPVQVGP